MSTHIKVTTCDGYYTLLLPIENIGVSINPDTKVYVFNLNVGENDEQGWFVKEPFEHFEEKLL